MSDPRLDRPSWRGRTNVDALTIACIEAAETDQLRGHRHQFVVTQGSYQPPGGGDENSAGTHDRGGVVDLVDCGHLGCYIALRRAGLAAWRRTRAQGPWRPHYHAVVIGHPDLHPLAAAQVRAYLTNTGNGLRGSARDDGPRLHPIPRPVWPPREDDTMPTPAEYAAAVLAAPIRVTNPQGKKRTLSVEQLLRETWQRQAQERAADRADQ